MTDSAYRRGATRGGKQNEYSLMGDATAETEEAESAERDLPIA